ncbi:ATP-binding protein [Staphylococcus felis]|uniref:quorum-sensing sensor histidine kinase AgrC n=2 Tax=Staphylococcus felis TaxID=46127 RepID=UPI000E239CD2|nr:ATP-binding protein [Staphylococcus felis]REI00830.1 ATP-binding protein [Staphylococcus felis]REI05247.1 ATP-binding protein [Staphylococcus felis]REI12648.1 ATP-binding protein [Staphylococcus felis]REI22814.1 ATP-binding protein [Staphylococcus felis]
MEILIVVVLSLFQAFVLFTVTNIILIDRPIYTRRDYLSILLGIVVPSTILFLFIGKASLFFLIFGFLILFFRKKKIIGIISVVVSVLILILCDFISTLFYQYILTFNLNYYIVQILYAAAFMFASFLIAFAFRKLMNLLKLSWLYVNRIYLLFLFALLVVFFITIYFYRPTSVSSLDDMLSIAYLVMLYFLAFISVITLVTISVAREIRYRRSQKEVEDYYKYTLQIEKINNRMRKFRHDYINILSTMSEYLREEDIEGLKQYFSDHITPLKSNFEMNTLQLNGIDQLKVREIKGLITTKILQAQENHIEISVEVADEITQINMELIDLSRALGIIMDNAIEASLNIENPMIQIAFIKTDNSVLIIIMNKAPKNLPKLHTLFKEGFSTKGGNRGLGLSTLKEITDNTENVLLDTTIENQYFIQKLEIMNEEM